MVLGLFASVGFAGADEWAADEKRIQPLPRSRPPIPEVPGRYAAAIDRFLAVAWREAGVKPARVCDDRTFVRRIHLDLAGVIPTVDQVEQFLARGPNRRSELVNELLASNRYAEHWTTFWGDLLLEQTNVQGADPYAFRDYIRRNLERNVPYDVWVRDMLSAEGSARENPASLFILRHDARRDELTIATTQVFLGIQLRCAQCHDHPYEAWKKDDFDGLQAFFNGTRLRPSAAMDAASPGRPLFEIFQAEPSQPRGRFITAASSERGRGRDGLADLVTRRDNPYFARAAVNRLWHKLFGVGLVEPPDGFSVSNRPSHMDLLNWLAMEFVEGGYDLKHMIRLICNSQAYQLSGGARGEIAQPGEPWQFARSRLRRMTAEQLTDSILVVCGLAGSDQQRLRPAFEQSYPPLPGSLLETFGAHHRRTSQERDVEATIPQALALLNGDYVNQAVRMRDDHPVRLWLESGMSREQVVDRLFVHALTREPDRVERELALVYAHTPETWSDLLWALINTREFMFIH